MMNKPFVLFLVIFSVSCLAQDKVHLVQRILPEHVEKSSIKVERYSTNTFVVKFLLTEAAKKDRQAFELKHAGQPVSIEIGSFKRNTMIGSLDSYPPGWTNDVWKKRLQQEFRGLSEEDARTLVEGLRGK